MNGKIMAEVEHVTTLRFYRNKNGVPVVSVSPNAHISLEVQDMQSDASKEPGLPRQPKVVSIHGNRDGLVALAEQLIAIAHADIEGYHCHFDSECPPKFLNSDGNWELLIGRNDKRAIRETND